MIKRITVILLLSVLLASCGFHLRGKYEYAAELNPIFVASEDRDFIYELEEVFDFSDLEIAESITGAAAILEFTSEIYERKPVTIDDRGRATRYRLKYTSRYRVMNRKGEALLRSATASASRILDYDSTQVLQADSEEDFLKQEIYEDMAQAVGRRLARVTGEVVATVEQMEAYDSNLKLIEKKESKE